MALVRLYLSLCSHDDASATSLISLLHALDTIYVCTRWEVWSLDILHQAIGIDVRIVDICTASVDYLTKVVGWHISCHTYGNTVTTIHEEVRNFCRHHCRLLQRVIEVVHHIDGILLKVVHDMFAHL